VWSLQGSWGNYQNLPLSKIFFSIWGRILFHQWPEELPTDQTGALVSYFPGTGKDQKKISLIAFC